MRKVLRLPVRVCATIFENRCNLKSESAQSWNGVGRDSLVLLRGQSIRITCALLVIVFTTSG